MFHLPPPGVNSELLIKSALRDTKQPHAKQLSTQSWVEAGVRDAGSSGLFVSVSLGLRCSNSISTEILTSMCVKQAVNLLLRLSHGGAGRVPRHSDQSQECFFLGVGKPHFKFFLII